MLLCLLHSFHPTCGLSSLCHLWSQFAPVWSPVKGVFFSFVFSQQTTLLKHSSHKTHQWTDGTCRFTQNRKQNHCPQVHRSQKVRNPPGPFDLTGGEFFMLMRTSEGFDSCHVKTVCLKQIVADWTLLPEVLTQELCSPLNSYPQETSSLFLQDTKKNI